MASASLPLTRDWRDRPTLRRGVSITLAVIVHVLMLLMLLNITPDTIMDIARSGAATTVDLLPDPTREARQARKAATVAPKASTAAASKAKAAPPQAKAVAAEPTRPFDVIPLTHNDFAAGDIAGLPNRKAGAAGDTGQQADANGGGPGKGVRGPGGEQLYNADWYRRPTSTELAFYLPKNRQALGWGEIACRTIEGYRVEDCALLGESPAGSGLGRAVLNAAWQFRVQPPRIGGRPLIGSWVRIRIEYTDGGARLAD